MCPPLDLSALTAQQKKELLDQLISENLLTTNPRKAEADRDVEMWSVAVHRSLVEVVGGMGGPVEGVGVLRKVLKASTAWEPVATFMRAAKLSELQVAERQQAYYLLADLLVRYARVAARRSGAPLSPKLVANCAQNIAGVFEGAFPGYVEAGLAKMVIRARAS